jgi:hypothetical protein
MHCKQSLSLPSPSHLSNRAQQSKYDSLKETRGPFVVLLEFRKARYSWLTSGRSEWPARDQRCSLAAVGWPSHDRRVVGVDAWCWQDVCRGVQRSIRPSNERGRRLLIDELSSVTAYFWVDRCAHPLEELLLGDRCALLSRVSTGQSFQAGAPEQGLCAPNGPALSFFHTRAKAPPAH